MTLTLELVAVGLLILLNGFFVAAEYALVTARMPEGMRNLGVACLRYSAQASAYAFLLTSRYPYAAPVLQEREQPEELVDVPLPLPGDSF